MEGSALELVQHKNSFDEDASRFQCWVTHTFDPKSVAGMERITAECGMGFSRLNKRAEAEVLDSTTPLAILHMQ